MTIEKWISDIVTALCETKIWNYLCKVSNCLLDNKVTGLFQNGHYNSLFNIWFICWIHRENLYCDIYHQLDKYLYDLMVIQLSIYNQLCKWWGFVNGFEGSSLVLAAGCADLDLPYLRFSSKSLLVFYYTASDYLLLYNSLLPSEAPQYTFHL